MVRNGKNVVGKRWGRMHMHVNEGSGKEMIGGSTLEWRELPMQDMLGPLLEIQKCSICPRVGLRLQKSITTYKLSF